MPLITYNSHLQITSDREPFFCGNCNHYTDCYIRREDEEPWAFFKQTKHCHHPDVAKQDYLEDDELILVEEDEEPINSDFWECDCDTDYTHHKEEERCLLCGVRCDDPTE